MDTSRDIIEAVFGGPGRTAIVRLLARASGPLTGRQIAERTGLSPSGAARALDRLYELGIVVRTPVGRAVLHALDSDHEIVRTLIAPALEAEERIAAARSLRPTDDVPPEVIECLVSQFDPLKIILFGSRATGTADEGSDYDLLVVLPELEDKHGSMVAMLVALGHLAVPVDVIPTDESEIRERGDTPGTVLNSALQEGRIVYERVA